MIFLTIFLLIFTYLFLSIWMRRRTLPPGPIPLPLLGNMHQLAFKMFVKKKDFAESIRDFVKEYGSVHTFWFGPLATVHICDYPNAADAMIRKGASFSNRELPYLFDLSRKGRGILAANDTHWLEQRRFALHTLKNFGLGRNIMEERIMFEFDITYADEEQFFALKAKLDRLFDDFELYDLLLNKWTMRIPFLRQRVDAMLKPQNDIVKFLQNQVDKRKKEIADGTHTFEGDGEDFVDAFLIQIEKEKQSNSPTSFDETTLAMTLLDLWTAGQETTATTLVWAFAYLLLHPQFDPDRYLKGENIEQHVIPFGIGKRACLGEALAKAELYLIIGNFLLRYGISADPNCMPTMIPQSVMGVVRKATPYNIVFTRS
ncbi:unspecific monooxygenase [Ancylostoma caninum]|uniref:Unspecific monooxygenase n=1 Tax=Ancylostoma caninum TaxID=29170 RepID=A0A368FF71_ANCCA|nr:unspecific monooxygenase [Ancylostoma caninum]